MLKNKEENFLTFLSLEFNLAPATLEVIKSEFKNFTDWLGNRPFTLENCRLYLLSKKNKGYKTTYLAKLNQLLRYLCFFLKKNFADKLPHFKKKYQPIPNILSTEEIGQIIACPREERWRGIKKTYDLLFEFLAITGCRPTEAFNLKVKDIKDGIVIFRQTKTQEDRYCPLSPSLEQKLKNYIKNKNPEDFVFTNRYKKQLKKYAVYKELEKRCQILKIRKINLYAFRHSFITEMLRANPPGGVAVVSKIVGHSNPLMTLTTYQHLVVEDMKKAILYHPLVKENISPQEIVEKIKNEIANYHLEKDKRFFYQLIEESHGVKIILKYF
ncbi:MAG: tyrosine-type recombinase/integrase [candidate division WOR-3 bacterium]